RLNLVSIRVIEGAWFPEIINKVPRHSSQHLDSVKSPVISDVTDPADIGYTDEGNAMAGIHHQAVVHIDVGDAGDGRAVGRPNAKRGLMAVEQLRIEAPGKGNVVNGGLPGEAPNGQVLISGPAYIDMVHNN